MLFSMLLLGCVGDSPEQVKNTYEDLDGEALLEAYNTAICDVYLQEGCIQAFDQCNEPIANYSNWADWMNSSIFLSHIAAIFPFSLKKMFRS